MLFRDPVITFGGRTYDREALEEFWQRRGEPIEPLSNSLLPERTVITNYDMRAQVEAFLSANPGYVPRGWKDRSMEPARAPGPVQAIASKEITRPNAGAAILFGLLFILLMQYFTGMWSCMELNPNLSSWPVACLEEAEIIDPSYVLPAEKLYNLHTIEELQAGLGVKPAAVARKCGPGDRGIIKARGSLGADGTTSCPALEEYFCREADVEVKNIVALELYDDRGLVVVGEQGVKCCSRALVDTRFAAVMSALLVSYILSRFFKLNLDMIWALGLAFAAFIGFEGAKLVRFGGVWPLDQSTESSATCSDEGFFSNPLGFTMRAAGLALR
jgi:hypothetical protein